MRKKLIDLKNPFTVSHHRHTNKVTKINMSVLTGRLEIYIDQAENLTNTDSSCFCRRRDTSDPYVTGKLGNDKIFKTKVVNNSLNPEWKENFTSEVDHEAKNLIINVKDKDFISSEHVGAVKIACDELLKGKKMEGWFQLKFYNKSCGRIKMSIQYFPSNE